MFNLRIKHLAFEPNMQESGLTFLNEEESSHLTRVLRMRIGDRLHTTDGCGNLFEAEIVELQKREAVLNTLSVQSFPLNPNPPLHIALAPLKQIDRFEWFIEKAVEIGVTSITPILTKRTERTALKHERLQKITIAAMKQSQRFWLPKLYNMVSFDAYLKSVAGLDHAKMMGWCGEDGTENLPKATKQPRPVHFLIGPEGDFTAEEAAMAKAAGFTSVSLGDYRLRTETAGIVAITLLQS